VATITSPVSLVQHKQPILIPQGPILITNQANDPVYWFQEGAIGDPATYNSVGANITIRTVYDRLNNDAHSYWIGSLLANGAFVQVGYLNGLSTTGQNYCCAWFYEYFPPQNTNSPPFIGGEGSAGPIGSWHTYSMISVGNGVWSFYKDNQYLGSSPGPGETYYLGASATNTGNHAVAGIAEVAQTNNDKDIIGPAEFKNMQYETTTGSWQTVPTGKVHIGYGATSSQNLANPYSVVEVEGVQNDFLAGSNIPKPYSTVNPDPCANSSDPSTLWTPTLSTCPANTSFNILDQNNSQLSPAWMSLKDGSNVEIFYTNYGSQKLPSPSSGQWNVTYVSWHSVNVASSYSLPVSGNSFTIPTRVFSVQISVVGLIYSLPVTNATVTVYLPDSTSEIITTDNLGQGTLTQLPPSNYFLHITVPNGISSNTNKILDSSTNIVAKVFSLPELLTIIIVPIVGAVIIVTMIVRHEARRRALMPQTQPFTMPTHCTMCGQPLLPGASFCQNCGTPAFRSFGQVPNT
jgi:hypothetical protein